MVWEIKVAGQLYDNSWTSIGLRFKKPNLEDELTPVKNLGGLEMYINGEMIGQTLIAVTENKGGSTQFKPLYFKIDGKDPPVVTLGCAWNFDDNDFGYFSGGEYDELAIWNRQLVSNATMDELDFMMGGYCKHFIYL